MLGKGKSMDILVIQNLREIQNNSYCDTSNFWNGFGCNVKFITRYNLVMLEEYIENSQIVVFGSNCLKDEQILRRFQRESTRKLMSDYVRKNNSVVFMHQMLEDGTELNLFEGIDELGFRIVKKDGKLKDMELVFSDVLPEYRYFPNKIEPKEVLNTAADFGFISGVYWHLYESLNHDFCTIMADNEENALISISRNYSVVFASMLLDWQKHKELTENIVKNLLGKGKCVAVVSEKECPDISYQELISTLENRKIFFIKYNVNVPSEISDLINRIHQYCHSLVLIDSVDAPKYDTIREACRVCGINCVEIDATRNAGTEKSLNWHDYYSSSEAMLRSLEVETQRILGNSLIENSFGVTMQVLKYLTNSKELMGDTETKGDTQDERKYRLVCDSIEKHIRKNGSYDDTFGATCQMIWFFETFFDKKDTYAYEKLSKARQWLEGKNPDRVGHEFNIRERIEWGIACRKNRSDIFKKCFEILNDEKLGALVTTYDLIELADLSMELGHYDDAQICIERLIPNGTLEDYAEDEDKLMKICMIITKYLEKFNESYCEDIISRDKYQACLVKGMGKLRGWDPVGKNISKNMEKCCLFLRYEKLIYCPIDTILTLYGEADGCEINRLGKAVNTLEEYRVKLYDEQAKNKALNKEKNDIVKMNKKLESKLSSSRKIGFVFLTIAACVVIVSYIGIWFLVWLIQNDAFAEMFKAVVVENWGYHTAIVSAIIAIMAAVMKKIIDKYFPKIKSLEDKADEAKNAKKKED